MKIEVFETIEDLGSVLLGIVTDVDRKIFDEACVIAEQQGIEVVRYDTRTRSEEIQNMDALPTIKLNGSIVFESSYPTIQEFSKLLNLSESLFEIIQVEDKLHHEANATRVGLCCGVGTDIYLDPNEEDEVNND